MNSKSRPLTYAEAHRPRFVAELMEFIRFPTIGAQPRHAGDLVKCADWLAKHLCGIGLDHARVVHTGGHPLVYADWLHAPGRPTVLIYGHYDVQPVDPLGDWISPPFEPEVRGDDLFGRGASDDKGQLFAHVKALESYLRSVGRLPANVRCLFEGEEESGSQNLRPFLERYREELDADVAVLSDSSIPARDRPAITYALRGALDLELEVIGQSDDLHSGVFGGAVHNPLQALCEIIATLHEKDGRVAVAGFYDRVRPDVERERAYLARVGPNDTKMLQDARATGGWGEPGYSLYERTTLRPAVTINGLRGGYQGPGGKAVIPARAFAKLSIRLVPDQEPNEIDWLLRRHIARVTPRTVRCIVRSVPGSRPTLVDRSHSALRTAAAAYRAGFGADPVFLRSGGTVPVVSRLQELLGIATVLMGFALPDDCLHAPNEKFHLPNFFNGIATSIRFLSEIGNQASPASRSAQTTFHEAHDHAVGSRPSSAD